MTISATVKCGEDWEQRISVVENDEVVDMTGFSGFCQLRPKGDYSDTNAVDLSDGLVFDDLGVIVSISRAVTSALAEGDYWFDVLYLNTDEDRKGTSRLVLRVRKMVSVES